MFFIIFMSLIWSEISLSSVFCTSYFCIWVNLWVHLLVGGSCPSGLQTPQSTESTQGILISNMFVFDMYILYHVYIYSVSYVYIEARIRVYVLVCSPVPHCCADRLTRRARRGPRYTLYWTKWRTIWTTTVAPTMRIGTDWPLATIWWYPPRWNPGTSGLSAWEPSQRYPSSAGQLCIVVSCHVIMCGSSSIVFTHQSSSL